MPPDHPLDPRPQRVISSHILPTQPSPARAESREQRPLADRLVTYLERLSGVSAQTAALRTAYRSRLIEPARPVRPEPVAERAADPERGRER